MFPQAHILYMHEYFGEPTIYVKVVSIMCVCLCVGFQLNYTKDCNYKVNGKLSTFNSLPSLVKAIAYFSVMVDV